MKYVRTFEDFNPENMDELINQHDTIQDEGFSIERAIKAALSDAEEKKEAGLLFKDFDEEGEHKDFDWSKGDPETIHSLVSLYSDHVTGMSQEEAADEIYNALAERFPELID